jgi:hypothetical protein
MAPPFWYGSPMTTKMKHLVLNLMIPGATVILIVVVFALVVTL